LARLGVGFINAGISQVRVSHHYYLTKVRGISENFLVAAHSGIKNRLAAMGSLRSETHAFKKMALF
jgi:hypothetical protein